MPAQRCPITRRHGVARKGEVSTTGKHRCRRVTLRRWRVGPVRATAPIPRLLRAGWPLYRGPVVWTTGPSTSGVPPKPVPGRHRSHRRQPRRGRRNHRQAVACLPGGSRETHFSTQRSQAGKAPRLPPPHVDSSWSHHREVPPPSRPRPAVSLIERVSGRDSFVELRRAARRVRRGTLRIAYLPAPSDRVRIAYALPRRVGNAVVRNRVRRRLRAAFMTIERAGQVAFPQGTYLVSASADTARVPFSTLVATAEALLRELAEGATQ